MPELSTRLFGWFFGHWNLRLERLKDAQAGKIRQSAEQALVVRPMSYPALIDLSLSQNGFGGKA
jgi:hypothetical protein